MIHPRTSCSVAGLACLALLYAGSGSGAQTTQTTQTTQTKQTKQPNPFQGFSSDNGKPVDVKSDELEVHQNESKAIFIGNVVATQGDSVLHSQQLIVFYDNSQNSPASSADHSKDTAAAQTKDAAAAASQPGKAANNGVPTGTSSIKRLEASGGVVVTSQDQKATGATGVFDMAANTATLNGDVVLTQGQSVIRGKQLVVDMKTGIAHVLGGTTGLFVPTKDQGKPGAPAKPK